MVARWHIFKPKIPIWVNLEGLAMEDVAIFNGHFVANWYILDPLVDFRPF
jgi:hypothetical protein